MFERKELPHNPSHPYIYIYIYGSINLLGLNKCCLDQYFVFPNSFIVYERNVNENPTLKILMEVETIKYKFIHSNLIQLKCRIVR